MLLFCEVGDEYAFFEKVWRLLADDIQYQFRDMIGNQNYQMPDGDVRNRLLDDLTALFAKSGSNIHNFNHPHRTSALLPQTIWLKKNYHMTFFAHLISQAYYHHSMMSILLPSIL